MMEQESGSKIYLTVVLLYENILNHFLDFQRYIIFLRKISPSPQTKSSPRGREQRYLRPRAARPSAAGSITGGRG